MIHYVENPDVTVEDVLPLYEAVGWTNYTTKPEMLILFIQDILVTPEYQHQGIGTKLLQQTLEKYKNVYQIQLTTDNSMKTISFYESNGFTSLTSLNCVSFIYSGNE